MENKDIFKYSLLVSNIFDPLTHDTDSLEKLYYSLSENSRYQSIETRVVKGDSLIKSFNELKDKANWSTTYWVTGEISRAGLNPSSIDEGSRIKAVREIIKCLDTAVLTKCDYIGIASGECEDEGCRDKQIGQFERTVKELLDYIHHKNYAIKLIIEPLDAFAHKRNVLGTTEAVLNFLRWFPESVFRNKELSICWDSAHFALNEDDFSCSIKRLAPYISRVHFADAVLDKNSGLYGDWHIMFGHGGFMNVNVAASILKEIVNSQSHQNEIFVSVEIREHEASNVWNLEEYSYQFVKSALEQALGQ